MSDTLRRTDSLLAQAMAELSIAGIAPLEEDSFHEQADAVNLTAMADEDARIIARGILAGLTPHYRSVV